MANSQRMTRPAAFALDHKADLALTPEQISFLEFLVVAQRDSAAVRGKRMLAAMHAASVNNPPSAAATAAVSWTGEFDEKVLRDELCKQSANQFEATINIYRDRHAVGAVLTPAQAAKMPQLEAADMMKILQRR